MKEDWSGLPRTDQIELIANNMKALRLFTQAVGSVDVIKQEYPHFLIEISALINANKNTIVHNEAA